MLSRLAASGRIPPLNLARFTRFERLLLIRADIQIVDFKCRSWTGRVTDPMQKVIMLEFSSRSDSESRRLQDEMLGEPGTLEPA